MSWYIKVLKNYVGFSGRARRKEYWMFALFNLIISIVLMAVDGSAPGSVGMLGGLYSLGVFLPALAVTFRRLHDTNRSAWWLLLVFVPILGGVALLVFVCLDGTRGPNPFGADPKRPTSDRASSKGRGRR